MLLKLFQSSIHLKTLRIRKGKIQMAHTDVTQTLQRLECIPTKLYFTLLKLYTFVY